MKVKYLQIMIFVVFGGLFTASTQAAVALDRTRVIYNGADQSMTINIENRNKLLPYLAQSWLEDKDGKKISSPLTALPPIQRIEPGMKSQVKLQGITAGLLQLPQDKESLFYFNLREIPPKSKEPNTLQIALQTRIKLFYRPEKLAVQTTDKPFQEGLTLKRSASAYTVINPTPYFVTLINVKKSTTSPAVTGFKPLMIPPKSEAALGVGPTSAGDAPVLMYINDFGGRPKLVFQCRGNDCQVARSEKG
ncbi:fimbria/pilus periplasmic chaperone [Kluyvera intermedia]|uniref:fimbria/pilus periplasmic chaperone n=1 Tax=Kluyvera intermedia TaxID=61648 RepID=UPI0035259D0D